MTTPIPRPPGLWRAIARDSRLNPEEAAARAAVTATQAELEPPTAAPPLPEDDPINWPVERRLAPYQSRIERAGWKAVLVVGEDRARLDGFHADGAAVMLTAMRGRKVYVYVLPPTGRKTPRWRAVNASTLEDFLRRRKIRGFHYPVSGCTCTKRRYPTEATAKAAIVDITIRRVVKEHGIQSERRVYRCPDDDRAWHITHIPKWYSDDEPKQKTRTR